MKLNVTIKSLILDIICLLYIVLFVYAAVSKSLDFQNFQAQLGQSPLLSAYTGFISISVLIAEFIISIVLAVPKLRFIGMFLAFSLMVMFTSYIAVILNYSSYIPCSCGGILEKMGWKAHLIFNVIFIVLAIVAIFLMAEEQNHILKMTLIKRSKITLVLFLISVASVLTILLLYVSSESLMHKNNPFIRRFIQGAAIKDKETNLPNNSYYFAGLSKGKIYLANSVAPLSVIVIDTTLKTKNRYTIQLDRYDYPFRTVQVRIVPPYFYLVDGTVPVIFKGNISDWKAKAIMKENNHYFSNAVIIDSNEIIFRTQDSQSHENILGKFLMKDSLAVVYARDVLQKQIDGFFDTDGIMQYNAELKRFVYLYYYRNQFIVTDNGLKVVYRGKTIDTTAHAKLKVAYIKELGERKLSSPPYTVNLKSTLTSNLLFVNSAILGRFESKEMWKQASIVDVYDIRKNTYLSSIYIYNAGSLKMNDMIADNSNLYVLLGYHLHKYKLGTNFNIKARIDDPILKP
jgi:uncharacterized membrane protein YphA (DoxX/SURF4 family)